MKAHNGEVTLVYQSSSSERHAIQPAVILNTFSREGHSKWFQ